MTITELTWNPHSIGKGCRQATVTFANGYTASVVTGSYFYTKEGYPYQIEVMRNGDPDYSTDITNDVLGYLSEDGANKALADIEALPVVATT